MVEYASSEKLGIASEAGDASIAGKPLAFYWRAGRLFAVLLILLEVIVIVAGWYVLGHWLVEAGVFVLLTWWLLRRFQVRLATALTAAIFVAVVVGLGLAIFEVIWYHQWWYLLDLIRRPFLIGAVGVAASFTFYLLFRSITIKRIR